MHAKGPPHDVERPFSPSPGFFVAFVLRDGAVFEFMTFEKESDLPWK